PDRPRDVLDGVVFGTFVELRRRPPDERVVDVVQEIEVELAGYRGRSEKLLRISELRYQPRGGTLPGAVVVVVEGGDEVRVPHSYQVGDSVELHRAIGQIDEGHTEKSEIVALRESRLDGVIHVDLHRVVEILPV